MIRTQKFSFSGLQQKNSTSNLKIINYVYIFLFISSFSCASAYSVGSDPLSVTAYICVETFSCETLVYNLQHNVLSDVQKKEIYAEAVKSSTKLWEYLVDLREAILTELNNPNFQPGRKSDLELLFETTIKYSVKTGAVIKELIQLGDDLRDKDKKTELLTFCGASDVLINLLES